MRKLAAFMLFFVFLAGAPFVPTQAAPFKINSGKTLEILGIKPEKSAAGTSLVLQYATPLPLADLKGLRREADELWEHFSANAEAAKATRAVVRASHPKQRENAVDFVYVKRNGIWHTIENGLKGNKLSKQFIHVPTNTSNGSISTRITIRSCCILGTTGRYRTTTRRKCGSGARLSTAGG